MNDSGNVPLWSTEFILQRWIKRSGEGARVDALPVMFHRFYYRPGANVFPGGLLRSVTRIFGEYPFGKFAKSLGKIAGSFGQGRIFNTIRIGVRETSVTATTTTTVA